MKLYVTWFKVKYIFRIFIFFNSLTHDENSYFKSEPMADSIFKWKSENCIALNGLLTWKSHANILDNFLNPQNEESTQDIFYVCFQLVYSAVLPFAFKNWPI